MGIRVLPRATGKERLARFRQLMALRQQGSEIGGFAQLFWSLALGLGYNDEALKEFLNICLDDSLFQEEMEGLRILDFWGFVKYFHHRSSWATPGQSEPIRRDFPTSPGLPTPTGKRRLRRRRAAKFLPVVSSSVVREDLTPVVSESTPELALVQEPSESTPELALVQEPSEFAPELAPVQKPSEFTSELALVHRGANSSEVKKVTN